MKSANTNIQTMAERIAKYELQMMAERDGGLDSAGVSARVN